MAATFSSEPVAWWIAAAGGVAEELVRRIATIGLGPARAVPGALARAALTGGVEPSRAPRGVVAAAGELGPPESSWQRLDAPRPALVVVAGAAELAAASAHVAAGADAWLPWPSDDDLLARALAGAAARARLADERRALHARIFGACAAKPDSEPAWQRAIRSPEATVLIHGGSPAGRAALAHELHRAGERSAGPWVECEGTLAPPEIADAWSRAGGGTLHVTEPGRLAPDAQRALAALLAAPPRTAPGLRPGARLVASAAGEPELVDELDYRLNALRIRAVDDERPAPVPADPERLDDLERRQIERVLAECAGNRSEAARRLGLHRATLHAKLKRWRGGD